MSVLPVPQVQAPKTPLPHSSNAGSTLRSMPGFVRKEYWKGVESALEQYGIGAIDSA